MCVFFFCICHLFWVGVLLFFFSFFCFVIFDFVFILFVCKSSYFYGKQILLYSVYIFFSRFKAFLGTSHFVALQMLFIIYCKWYSDRMLFGASTNNPFVLITCIVNIFFPLCQYCRYIFLYFCFIFFLFVVAFYLIFVVHYLVKRSNVSVPYLLQVTDSVICNRQYARSG